MFIKMCPCMSVKHGNHGNIAKMKKLYGTGSDSSTEITHVPFAKCQLHIIVHIACCRQRLLNFGLHKTMDKISRAGYYGGFLEGC